MDFAKLTQLVLGASIMMIVLSMGLQATFQEATYLFRQPRRFIRSLFAMSLVMPVFAGVLASVLALPPPVAITLIVLSVSPVPPILPRREMTAGGSRSYALGLLVAISLVSILTVPVSVDLFGRIFDRPARLSPVSVGRVVTATVIGPLAIGLALRSVWGATTGRLARPLARVATALLIAGLVPVLFTQTSAAIDLIGNGTLLAIAAFVVVGLFAGALLGGPALAERIVLALSTACRHPGIAVAIARENFPDQKLIVPVILLYLIVSVLLASVFLRWIRRNASENSAGRRTRAA
jgi:BASS family bile acid:Na+ symporter